MNSVFWRRKISYILKEKCGEVGAHRGECSDKLFYMIGLWKSRGMSGVVHPKSETGAETKKKGTTIGRE